MKDNLITFFINHIFRNNKDVKCQEKAYWDKFWKNKISSEKFSEIDYWFQKKVYKRMHNHFLSVLEDLNGKKILEAGCGSGYASILFAREGADCSIMDSSELAIEYSKKLAKKIGASRKEIKYFIGNAEKIPFDNESFDIIYNCGVIEHYNDEQIKRILLEMKRVLKKDGQIIAVIPNLLSLEIIHRMIKYGKGSERYISRHKLKKMLKKVGLKNVEARSSCASVLPSFIPKIAHDKFLWIDNVFKFWDYLFYARGFK